MRQTGGSTRLFHAIVALGLGAAASGCGGQTRIPPPADAAQEAPSIDAPEDSPAEVGDDAQDATASADADADAGDDAGDDAADTGDDHWVPRIPVIA